MCPIRRLFGVQIIDPDFPEHCISETQHRKYKSINSRTTVQVYKLPLSDWGSYSTVRCTMLELTEEVWESCLRVKKTRASPDAFQVFNWRKVLDSKISRGHFVNILINY